jgi:hypothetical protein
MNTWGHGGMSKKIGTCPICKREGRGLVSHHMVPRAQQGTDGDWNRLEICCTCERFLHTNFGNIILADTLNTKEVILSNREVISFGTFLRTERLRHARLADMRKTIAEWRSWKIKTTGSLYVYT